MREQIKLNEKYNIKIKMIEDIQKNLKNKYEFIREILKKSDWENFNVEIVEYYPKCKNF